MTTVSIFEKMIEVILARRLTEYFVSCGLFTDCQYGFRKNHSTFKAVYKLFDIVVGHGGRSTICHRTLRFAFDCVFFQKLEYY